MQPAQQLLLLSRDRDTARAVSRSCEAQGGADFRVSLIQDFAAFETALDNRSVLVALIDVEPEPFGVLERLEALTGRYPETRFVLLCEEFDQEFALEAMQVGARHCLVKSAVEEQLLPVVRRLVHSAAAKGRGGEVVTVLSAGGGCGATTVAVNVAEELRLSAKAPVLLIDLDQDYGPLSSYLGLSAEYGIADVLAHPHSIDSELIRSTAAFYGDDFQVLLSPASIDFAHQQELSFDNLEPTLFSCSTAFPFTVVDAPRVPMDVAAILARNSALTLLVLELDVVSVRTAKSILRALEERRVPLEHVVPVVNRYKKRTRFLDFKDAQEALKGNTLGRIRNDFNSACRAINFGQPLARVAPRSVIRKDLRALISTLLSRPAGPTSKVA